MVPILLSNDSLRTFVYLNKQERDRIAYFMIWNVGQFMVGFVWNGDFSKGLLVICVLFLQYSVMLVNEILQGTMENSNLIGLNLDCYKPLVNWTSPLLRLCKVLINRTV